MSISRLTDTGGADSRQRPLGDAPHWRREHFIPVRREALFKLLESQSGLTADERDQFRALVRLLEATIHHQHHEHVISLKRAYAPFNPDDDTRSIQSWTADERATMKDQLFCDLQLVMERANYQRLTRAEIEQAVDATSDWGVRLHVEFSVFERLEVYVRGDVVGRRTRRTWRNWFRQEEVAVPIYQRLVVAFCIREDAKCDSQVDSSAVYLKLFKNIPKIDVDMLLPGSRIRMTMLDRGKIILPTLSGATLSIVKIVQGALAAALTATLWGMLITLGFIIGLIGYGLRSFMGYLSTRDRYQLSLTRNLYYQNLDNNAGVFFRLLDEAEEQEIREALVAYYVLWKRGPIEGWMECELDRAAEQFLRDLIQVEVDFESNDAIEKLQRFGLAECNAEQRWTAISPSLALSRMDSSWDRLF